MAQTIEEQVNTVERALGERMIEHALAVVRAWLNELGENNPFEQAFADIQTQYNAIFADWLVNDDQEKQDQQLNELTSDAYRFVDAVYVQIRLFRGLSPHMRGYNNESAASIMHYFSRCLELTEADYTWLQNSVNSSAGGSSSVRVEYVWKPVREVALETKFYTYTNYKHVEIDLEVNCDFIINRFMSARLTLHPRYDSSVIMKGDERAKIQFRELLSIGFAHKFR